MGLEIIGTPIEFGGARQGSLFACGFLVDEKSGKARPHAMDEVEVLKLPVVQPGDAFESIQRIEAREVPRLADLMDTTVEEIDAYHDAVALREKRIRDLQDELEGRYRFADIIGKSEPMRRLYALLDKLVDSDVTVLVHGENGTGKELIARALHFNGPRKQRQFVAQNCSALNDQLLESELFGHVKGSFTGATRDKPGLFKVADGGTFFLDEVADMSAAMQVKLLRVLQEGTFVPVGGTKPEKVDVRIIAASNKDLREMVMRREFREDLFYRLHVVALEVPALRERLDDLPVLVDHFLDGVSKRTGKARKKLHPELMAAFYDWQWPGNVRELENEIERLCVLAGDAEVVPPELRAQRPVKMPGSAAHLAALVQRGLGSDLATAVGALEKELIETGLRETKGNKSKLAERLGVSRTTLIKKIRDYGIAE
jgi:transcriptional regulator with PAS, ATPase and Fis domain